LTWLVASTKNPKPNNQFSLHTRALFLGSSSFSSRKSCTVCFSFQNRFSTCPLESQRTSQWRMRSPYSSSSSSQYYLNCFLFNLFALILFTHLTTGTITCYKFKTSTQRILVNNAMILGEDDQKALQQVYGSSSFTNH